MTATRNIALFDERDGLEPGVVQKLNYDFRALMGIDGTDEYAAESAVMQAIEDVRMDALAAEEAASNRLRMQMEEDMRIADRKFEGVYSDIEAFKADVDTVYATKKYVEETEDSISSFIEKNYTNNNDLATKYSTKSELTQTAESVRAAVTEDFESELTNYTSNAALEVKLREVRLGVSEEIEDKVSGEAAARNAAITVKANEILDEVSGTYATNNTVTQMNTKISRTANAITSLARGETTYTNPDGTTVTSSIGTSVEQNATSVKTAIEGVNGLKTVIQDTQGGTIVGVKGKSIAARVAATGAFEVVNVWWSGDVANFSSVVCGFTANGMYNVCKLATAISTELYVPANGYNWFQIQRREFYLGGESDAVPDGLSGNVPSAFRGYAPARIATDHPAALKVSGFNVNSSASSATDNVITVFLSAQGYTGDNLDKGITLKVQVLFIRSDNSMYSTSSTA